MSFVSFLKKAGQVLANIGAIEAGIAPIFKAAVPEGSAVANGIDKLDLLFKSVVATEGQFATAFPGQQTGPQKLLAASSLVGPILATVETIAGKNIANEAAYIAAIQEITKGVADLMNAINPHNAEDVAASSVSAPAASVSTK